MSALRELFSFPNPVNEISARLVAGIVVFLTLATIWTGEPVLFAILAYGFLARVATGPTLSPVGLLVTRVIVPMLGNPSRPVPGPPKRFAQAVGLAFSLTALILVFAMDSAFAARVVLVPLAVFAFIEAFVGFCAGCFVFSYLMRWGFIPEQICKECVISPELVTE